jgi:hypothetical protein
VSSGSLPAPPESALRRLLPADVDLQGDLRHPAARPVWLGVVWSRLGRGDLAWQFWDRVGATEVLPWLAAERGRVLRELGLHAEAERLEWPALAAATDPVDAAMLRVSLTADAVGRGDLVTVERRFEAATAAVGALPDGPRAARQRLRLSWVAAEVAWVRGRAPTGEGLPWLTAWDGAGFPPDYAHGTAFHRAKGLLFAGLVRGSSELLDLAAAEAPEILAWAIHLARADLGAADGLARARAAWRAVVPPPEFAAAVAFTPTAQRLRGAVPG